jgi:hypothetical protein
MSNNPNARVYVEGASRSLDSLVKSYEKLEKSPLAERLPAEERDPADPFGLTKKKKKSADPLEEGKEAAERVTKFIALCAAELGLSPENVIFAVELAALNTLNAKDCPVPAERIEQIRQAAFEYYRDSLPKIPG